MEFIENIKEKEYDDFLMHAKSHFMQTREYGETRKAKGYIPHLVGLKNKNKLVCTALLLERRIPFKLKFFYVPCGYTIDYNNFELLKEFTSELIKYAKKNKAMFIKIDPAVKRYTIDLDGNKVDGEDNTELMNYLKKIGYKHLGFNLAFEHEQPRFTFQVNIDKPMEEVYASFHATTRKVLNKGNQYNLKIYKGNKDDLPGFFETMVETNKREGIIQADYDYYEKFYETFHKANMSDLYVAKVNINDLKELFNQNILETKNKETKNDVQVKEKEDKLNKLNKILNEINEIKEDELTLASIMTVKFKDIVWTVHGGNHSKLMSLNANYLIYYEIIKDANKEGYKEVDLFGTCGIPNPTPDNPIYGIHNFKKRLGGEYIEFIGEFDLVNKKLMYLLYKIYTKTRNRLKK